MGCLNIIYIVLFKYNFIAYFMTRFPWHFHYDLYTKLLIFKFAVQIVKRLLEIVKTTLMFFVRDLYISTLVEYKTWLVHFATDLFVTKLMIVF